MSLSDLAKAARIRADATGEPGDIALADALESAERADAAAVLNQLREEPDMTGLPDPPVSHVRIPPPGTEN